MRTPRPNEDLRHYSTAGILSAEERLSARNEGMLRSFREQFPDMKPRVDIGKDWVPQNIARQYLIVKMA